MNGQPAKHPHFSRSAGSPMTRQVPARGDPDHTPLTDGGYTVSHPEPGTIEHLHLCCEVDGECACIDRGAEVRMPAKRLDHECCVLPAIFG
ncbi:MAG: hypothetical protein ACMVO3_09285 [Thalassobaculum sp.]